MTADDFWAMVLRPAGDFLVIAGPVVFFFAQAARQPGQLRLLSLLLMTIGWYLILRYPYLPGDGALDWNGSWWANVVVVPLVAVAMAGRFALDGLNVRILRGLCAFVLAAQLVLVVVGFSGFGPTDTVALGGGLLAGAALLVGGVLALSAVRDPRLDGILTVIAGGMVFADTLAPTAESVPLASLALLALGTAGLSQPLYRIARRLSDLNNRAARLEREVEARSRSVADSEERFALLSEGSIQGLVVHRQGRPLYANRSFAVMVGLGDPDEVLALPSLVPILGAVQVEAMERLLDEPSRRSTSTGLREFKATRPDGRELWLLSTSRPVEWDGQQAIQTTAIDISQSRLAAEELRRSEEHYRAVVEGVQSIIVQWQADGEVTFVNEYARSFFGRLGREIRGHGLVGRLVPQLESTGRNLEALFHAVARNPDRHARVDSEVLQAGGGRRWVSWSNTGLRGPDGQVREILSVGIDITRRREVEQQLARAKELAEAADASKSDFLANMSHEIRTPMNGVLGMTKLLTRTELDERQRRCVDTIVTCGEDLLRLINDILDFSKIEAEKVELEQVRFDLRDVLEDVAQLHAPAAYGKGVAIIWAVPPNLPVKLQGDPIRLRQALNNLVSNAVKFTSQGGVSIEVERRVGLHPLAVVVKDTGIGMDAEAQGKIFGAFTQGDSSTTRRFGGTGLGLAICQRLVDLMGGRIEVNSQLGTGSAFTVLLPLAELPDEDVLHDPLVGRRIAVFAPASLHGPATMYCLERWGADVRRIDSLEAFTDSDWQPELIVTNQRIEQEHLGRVIEGIAQVRPGVPLVVLRYFGMDQSVSTSAAVEVAVKPIRRRELHRSCCRALGLDADPSSGLFTTVGTDAPENPAWVLVVEDNLMNQQLTVAQLEPYASDVVLVGNGQEAVEVVRQGGWSLILMDCQMPVMDGFAATGLIRSWEAESGAQRVPIVAVTANVLSGDRERCLAAGMDDYIGKPVREEDLERVFARWVGIRRREVTQPMAPSGATGAGKQLADWRGQLPPERFNALIEVMGQELPRLRDEVRDALDSGALETLARSAHSIKGSASSMGFKELAACALDVEHQARAGDLPLRQLMLDFDSKLADLIEAVDEVLQH